MTAALAVSALRQRLHCVIRGDRAGPFGQGIPISKQGLRPVLKHNDLTGSMGRVGACGDNAAMESFFSLLHKNVLDRQRWESRSKLRIAIVTWTRADLSPAAASVSSDA